MDRDERMRDLFDMLCDVMSGRLKSGEASAADLKEIRGFLKDNGVELARMPGNKMDSLATALNLPFSDEDYPD